MRMIDIIEAKRDNRELSDEEISFFVNGYVKGDIPDYQVSSLLMAIYFNGMNKREIATLTKCMLYSGDLIDLSKIKGIKVDKHSTGGVGDKTSLVVGPICAACGLKLAKLSGRGLGHTGGTLDKMESIPGLSITETDEQFINQVNKIGIAIVGQSLNLVPADKKLYALRDVTGTVPSIPLIASSIMSKKLASGADCLFLDVKVGSGAFMKDLKNAEELSRTMVEIGHSFNRKVCAMLTNMDQPLGFAVGNSLEVIEAVNTLHGKGPKDFTELCIESCTHMLRQAEVCPDEETSRKLVLEKINNGEAFKKLKEFVGAQGGDISYLDNTEKFEKAKFIVPVAAKNEGCIIHIDALQIGEYAMKLGAGRETMDDVIDNAAGIVLCKKVGDVVAKGETLCYIHTNKENYKEIIEGLADKFNIVKGAKVESKLIYEVID
jgi:pyrimidine-nucleoside phosphorylase